MQRLLLPIFILLSIAAAAQTYNITGTIVDTSNKPLDFATIIALSPKDSTMMAFANSDEKGRFELVGINKMPVLVKITFVGFLEYVQKINSTEKSFSMGSIQLISNEKLLKEIQVTAIADPVKIKLDTVEYNAESFKTAPNSNVEDLLKKMPGLEVEKDGSIKAQGEQIKNVYVNGKKFFGNDPKIATKNLQADMIKKVQVFDKKSDVATFTGIDDGDTEKSINLEFKENKAQGWFGNTSAGIGDQERYIAKASINRFTKKQQLSFLGMSNNINQQGFSVEESMDFSGQSANMARGGGGEVRITSDQTVPVNFGNTYGFGEAHAAGVNYNDQWTPQSETNANYFFSQNNSYTDKVNNKINFLSDKTFYTNTISSTNSYRTSHKAAGTYEIKPDSSSSVKITVDANTRNATQESTSMTENTTGLDSLLNASNKITDNKTNGSTLRTNVLYRYRFAKKGRNIALNGTYRYNDDYSNGDLYSINTFRKSGILELDTIDQLNKQDVISNTYSGNINYTEPIGNRQYIEASVAGNYNIQNLDRRVFDRDLSNLLENGALSTSFDNTYSFVKPGLSYKLNRKLYNFSTGFQYQQSYLNSLNKRLGSSYDYTFSNFLPNIRFNYNFSSTKRLVFNYETSFREPSVTQLQPVINNTDPLNLSTGNPDLKPEYNHRVVLRLHSFSMLTQRSLFGNITFSYTKDRISNAQTITPEFIRISKPVNTPYEYTISSWIGAGQRIGASPFRINTNINGNFTEGTSFVNANETKVQRTTLAGTLRVEYRIDDKFEAYTSGRIAYNQSHYLLFPTSDQSNRTETYTFGSTVFLPKAWIINSDFNLDVYRGLSAGFNQTLPIWNAYIAKSFLKNNKGELRLAVRDILNKNTGISRRSDANYIEDERIRSLARYFMLTFTYTINKMPGTGMQRGGGMRMMMH